ncbi:hypothetical protein HCA81_01595 [Listeria booriae]|uniref:hypothetical protein n=1 Tax=Listeria booriae TaxID=1552123 RepID=UPI001627F75C|nr:hypothetical protein [Listeria booriae]MBC2019719.1 hypothetical protein [Listeria booriae]
MQDINLVNVKKAVENLPPAMQNNLRTGMRKHNFILDDIANPQQGKVAEILGAGGGTQIQLGTVVDWYEKLGLLKEVAK